jgi:flagellar hook-associated protein 2
MPLTATGIGSGLDVESLVSQLVLADIQPAEQRINRSEAKYQAEISAYGVVKSALSAFQSAASSAATASQYRSNSATTSLFSAITATATSSAVEGAYELEVVSLASSQSLASTAFTATSDVVGTGTLTLSIGTSTYNSGTDTVDSFVAKSGVSSVDITIDGTNNTLAGVRDAINAADAGVTASIINDGSGYRLVLKSNTTGAENAVNISVADTGDSNNTDANGLSRLAFNTSVTNLDQTKAASNASLTINGLAVSSASNSVADAVEGVTFSLKETTESPVTITVARDTAKAKAALEGFVNQFNELTKTLNSLTDYNADAEQGSLLTGDATLRTLARTIRNYLNTSVSNGGSYSTLAELGVTTKVLDGTLEIDSTKLQKVLDEDPTDIARVLAAFGTPSNSNVRFLAGTSATQEGTFSVSATETTTAGYWTAGSAVGEPKFNGSDGIEFDITIDGLGTQTISLGGNFDQTPTNGVLDAAEETNLADALRDEISTAFGVPLNSPVASVSFVGGVLTITSATTGSSSSVSVSPSAGSVSGNTKLGIAGGGSSTQGTSAVSYTINGEAASESDGVITGAVGTDVEGLQLEILGNATGDLGTISFSRGIAVQVNSLITDLLASDGLIEARLDGLNSSVKDLSSQRDALELRANSLEKRYRSQFNGLETLIAQLNTTQTYLSQALSGFVEPNTTLRK